MPIDHPITMEFINLREITMEFINTLQKYENILHLHKI